METIVTHNGDSYLADYTLYKDMVGLVRCKQPQHKLFNEWLPTDNKHSVEVEDIFKHGVKHFEMLDDGISILYHNVLYPFVIETEYILEWSKENTFEENIDDVLELKGFDVYKVFWVNEEAEEIKIEVTKEIKTHLKDIYYQHEFQNSEKH